MRPPHPRRITAAALYHLSPRTASKLPTALLDVLDRCQTLEAKRLIMRARRETAAEHKKPKKPVRNVSADIERMLNLAKRVA